MKATIFTTGLLFSALLVAGQSQKELPAQNNDKKTDRENWYGYLASKETEKATGLVLNGRKYRVDGFKKLQSVSKENITNLKIVKDSATIRKYFADTSVRFVLVVDTK